MHHSPVHLIFFPKFDNLKISTGWSLLSFIFDPVNILNPSPSKIPESDELQATVIRIQFCESAHLIVSIASSFANLDEIDGDP